MISLILRVLAAVCFGLLVFKVHTSVPLLALGLLFWVVATIVVDPVILRRDAG